MTQSWSAILCRLSTGQKVLDIIMIMSMYLLVHKYHRLHIIINCIHPHTHTLLQPLTPPHTHTLLQPPHPPHTHTHLQPPHPPHTHTHLQPPHPPSSLLTRVEAHYRDPDANPYPGGESEAVFDELTPYLETAGINEPLTKVSCLYTEVKHLQCSFALV